MTLPLPRTLNRLMLALALFAFTEHAAAAKLPVLMVLAHAEGEKAVATKVETKAGLTVSPDKGKPQAQWSLHAGEAIKAATRPGDRLVGFYQSIGNQSTLLFVVRARYYPNVDGKWIAQYQIDQDPLVTRANGRWQPLTTVQGAPSLIVITSNTLPNAEGYYSALDFRFTTGPTSIDAWMVQ